jgi:phosphatidylinositol alpha-mannosyltransferase
MPMSAPPRQEAFREPASLPSLSAARVVQTALTVPAVVPTRTSLRVGIVAENYFPTLGGIQEHLRHLRNFLTAAGAEVTIITGAPRVDAAMPGPRDADDHVVRLGAAMQYGVGGTFTHATFGPGVAVRMRRLLAEKQFDVLNIHGPCDVGLPTLANTLFAGPKVATLHSCFPHSWVRNLAIPYYRWVFGRSAGVIAVSDATRDAMARYARFDANVIPNGVDCAYWERGRRNGRYADASSRTLVYLGRLEARNGFDLLLDAFIQVARTRDDVRLLVAGDGPERAGYEAAVPAALRDRVRFLGALYDERPDLFASADMMVLPARAVGFSILVLEAFAAGLPVVSLPAIGVRQAGDHWRNVVLAEQPTADCLAAAIAANLDRDHAARVTSGRQIAADYDWSRIGPRILDVLTQAAGARDQHVGA